MGISLGGVKAWDVSEMLPPDTYLMRPAPGGVERAVSSNGNEQVQVTWRVAYGEFQGAEQRDWVTFTETAMGRVVQLIEACGEQVPQQDFASYADLADWVAGMLKKDGVVTEAVIRLKPGRKDPSKEFPEVIGYRQPTDLPSGGSGVTGASPKVNGNGNGADAKPLPF